MTDHEWSLHRQVQERADEAAAWQVAFEHYRATLKAIAISTNAHLMRSMAQNALEELKEAGDEQ